MTALEKSGHSAGINRPAIFVWATQTDDIVPTRIVLEASTARITQTCGARTRLDGHPCKRKALANGRCPNHGGMSSGPKTPEGLARISAAQKARWQRIRAALAAVVPAPSN